MKTEIAYILDRSGSMDSIWSDAIGGLNSFIEEQKKVKGECKFSLTVFDTQFDVLIDGKDLQQVTPVLPEQVSPRGMTALLDAIGKTINTLAQRNKGNEPGKTIVCIMTDGLENASKEYNKTQIRDRITHLEKEHAWEFIFVGAGVDVFAEATALGAKTVNIMNVSKDKRGVDTAANYMSSSTATYRSESQDVE